MTNAQFNNANANKEGTMARKSNRIAAAEICLYGTTTHGAGFIVAVHFADGTQAMHGDGEIRQGRTFTDALILARMDLAEAGCNATTRLAVHMDRADGIPMVANLTLGEVRYAGDLRWTVAEPALEITADQIDAMAEVM